LQKCSGLNVQTTRFLLVMLKRHDIEYSNQKCIVLISLVILMYGLSI
jgi:hypothetical protein